jgi:DNA-binding transcriptional ArsR family regulator
MDFPNSERSPARDVPVGGSRPSLDVGRVSASEAALLALDARRATHLAAIFSNPTRSKMLFLLAAHSRLTVGSLAVLVGSSVSSVSHHLAQLRTEGWVVVAPVGRMRQVRLANPHRALAVQQIRDAARTARGLATEERHHGTAPPSASGPSG